MVDADETIENGTMVIKDGIISLVGTKINIPQGSVIYDLKGKSIYPGLIDAYSNYGMSETKKSFGGGRPQVESNTKGAYGWNQAIKPETDAVKMFIKDIKAAERFFNQLGIVNFSKAEIIRLKDFESTHYGKPSDGESLVTLAFTGDTFIEIIQPLSRDDVHQVFTLAQQKRSRSVWKAYRVFPRVVAGVPFPPRRFPASPCAGSLRSKAWIRCFAIGNPPARSAP